MAKKLKGKMGKDYLVYDFKAARSNNEKIILVNHLKTEKRQG